MNLGRYRHGAVRKARYATVRSACFACWRTRSASLTRSSSENRSTIRLNSFIVISARIKRFSSSAGDVAELSLIRQRAVREQLPCPIIVASWDTTPSWFGPFAACRSHSGICEFLREALPMLSDLCRRYTTKSRRHRGGSRPASAGRHL